MGDGREMLLVEKNSTNVNYYRSAVQAESGLVAFFPVDGNTGATLTNTVDAGFNGILEGNAAYDGRTNRAFGERALRLNGDGDVMIANNRLYEFTNGIGGLKDRTVTGNLMVSTTQSFQAPVLTPGVLAWDYCDHLDRNRHLAGIHGPEDLDAGPR